MEAVYMENVEHDSISELNDYYHNSVRTLSHDTNQGRFVMETLTFISEALVNMHSFIQVSKKSK